MEKDVFDDLQGYIVENGRDLAEKIWCYAECKGYDISEEEILNGFKTVASEYQFGMVERGMGAGAWCLFPCTDQRRGSGKSKAAGLKAGILSPA
jgi:hypothetical protein